MSETKSGAPERVWLDPNDALAGEYSTKRLFATDAEYVRADVVAQLVTALERARLWLDSAPNSENRGTAMMADAALTRYRSASPSTQVNEDV